MLHDGEEGLERIGGGEDADDLIAVAYRQRADPTLEQQARRRRHLRLRRHGDGILGHDRAHRPGQQRRARILESQPPDITVGDDAAQPVAVETEQVTDLAPLHLPERHPDRAALRHRGGRPRHPVPHGAVALPGLRAHCPGSSQADSRTVRTGHGASLMTRSATLPSSARLMPPRPCVPMSTRSASSSVATATTSRYGTPVRSTGRTLSPLPWALPAHSSRLSSAHFRAAAYTCRVLSMLKGPSSNSDASTRTCTSTSSETKAAARRWASPPASSAHVEKSVGT